MANINLRELDISRLKELRKEVDDQLETLKAEAAAQMRKQLEAASEELDMTVSEILNGAGARGRSRKSKRSAEDNPEAAS
jgi:F0F1-type ATP synthase membrane subunit b/b'